MANNPMQMFMQMMMSGGNPNQILQNMVRQNPQMNAILQQQRQSGMSMKDYAMQYAKQNNIDINPMLNMLKQRGIKY